MFGCCSGKWGEDLVTVYFARELPRFEFMGSRASPIFVSSILVLKHWNTTLDTSIARKWHCQDSNPVLQGDKHESCLFATPLPTQIQLKMPGTKKAYLGGNNFSLGNFFAKSVHIMLVWPQAESCAFFVKENQQSCTSSKDLIKDTLLRDRKRR